MQKFNIPAKLFVQKDEFGRLQAYTQQEVAGNPLAKIKVNRPDNGTLGAVTGDQYIANLRKKAVDAYKKGQTEIDA